MAGDTDIGGSARRGGRWTLALWGVATLLLLAPLAAMQVTDQMDWGPADFALLALLLTCACGAVELTVRASGSLAYRAAVGVAVVTAFLLVWINLAVGVIGDEGNRANLMFAGVLLAAVAGAVVARLRAAGMAWAMAAAALAQAAVAGVALAQGLEHPLPLSGGFVALWLTSAALFRKAAAQAPVVPA